MFVVNLALIFLHQRSLDISCSINIWGKISGILLQVFVATCNKGRGHIVEGKVGDTLGGFTILNVGFFKWGIDSIYLIHPGQVKCKCEYEY